MSCTNELSLVSTVFLKFCFRLAEIGVYVVDLSILEFVFLFVVKHQAVRVNELQDGILPKGGF